MCALLLRRSPACHWILDSQFVFVQAFGDSLELFQLPTGELMGRSVFDLLAPAAVDVWRQQTAQALSKPASFMTAAREPDRPVFAVNLFPLEQEGASVRFIGGLAVDATTSQITERQLRTTALQVLSAQEAEQARLSRFLHDEVGQSLTAAGMQLDILRMDLEETVPGIATRTTEIQSMLEVVVDRIRDLSYELNPAIVERAGFNSALDRLAGRYRRTFSGTLRLLSDSSLRMPTEVGVAMYKIAAEAIQNAIRHAACSQIELLVKSTQNGPILEVRDNGRGFVPATGRRLGRMLMEHYATQAGLCLEIESQPGRGTVVRAVLESKPCLST